MPYMNIPGAINCHIDEIINTDYKGASGLYKIMNKNKGGITDKIAEKLRGNA